jgi:hypothetical protein
MSTGGTLGGVEVQLGHGAKLEAFLAMLAGPALARGPLGHHGLHVHQASAHLPIT